MRRSMPGWRNYSDCGFVTWEISTGAGLHRVTWDAGRLTLHNHSLRAERVLRGLGGPPCQCLLALDALTEYQGDWAFDAPTRPLARQLQEKLQSDPEYTRLPESERHGILLRTRRRLAMQILPAEITAIADHASGLRRNRRESAQALPSQGRETDPWDAAEAILQDTMYQVREGLAPYASVVAECWRRRPHGEPQLIHGYLSKNQGVVLAALRPAWINWVWTRGLAVVDGHFILDVSRPAPADSMEGLALRWYRTGGREWTAVADRCSLHRRDGQWEFQWLS
jgi:hypothetical protein